MGMKRIVIRADGNQQIAMGHVMRCLSIADELRDRGADIIFVTAGNETEELIRSRGFENHVLHSDFAHMEQELPSLLDFLKEYRPELILTDSYYVTDNYMNALRGVSKTAYIDDLGQPVYSVDILINYNIYGSELPYEKYYEEKEIKGEFVILLEGKEKLKEPIISEQTIEELMKQYLKEGIDKKEAMKKVAKDKGITKSEVYKHLLNNNL